MKVYRIEREKYLDSVLKGTGAALKDGFRWNSINTRLVYTAESRALAMLEVSVHLDLNEDFPSDRYYVEIDIPGDTGILELPAVELPGGWDSKPPVKETQFIGDEFVRDKLAAVLRVPSSIVPKEFNYLINPDHPDAKKIKVTSKVPILFDQRLKKARTK
ncbi:MAG: RES domain-containing protein [Bacteroidetes bacterium]|nr:MAG: RES domain-containing protein [Bacteroidota bacterium]